MYSLFDDPNAPIKKLVKLGFNQPEPQSCVQMSGGLINETWNIDNIWVLQRVNPIFGPAVNDDIAALTPILRQHAVTVPMLCKASNGEWSVEGSNYGATQGRWRLMTMLPGKSIYKTDDIEQIRELTRAIARFHRALDTCHYQFQHKRPGVHAFTRHYAALEKTVVSSEYKSHRLWSDVNALFEKIKYISNFVDYNSVMVCEVLRIIHGDPKISNFMFENGVVSGIVDLDTMARSRIAFDIGDAIRSWCNPRAEDDEPAYNREFAREVLGLYQEEMPVLTHDERASLPISAPFITLELAMRFAKDALCEDYFGFNPEIGHGEHSLMRAKAMYELCGQML